MASGTFAFHAGFFVAALNEEIDFASDTIKLMFSSSSYVPNVDTHDYKDDVTNEVTGTNWAAGGVTLATPTVTVVGASNRVKIDADDVSVATVTATGFRVATIYDNSSAGADTGRPIIGTITFDGDMSPSAGTMAVTFDSNGIGYFSY